MQRATPRLALCERICTQPHCALRSSPDTLAPALLDGLEGRTVATSESRPIERRDACLECVGRVLGGRPPLPTLRLLWRSQRAGDRSRRRRRRATARRSS